jgi:lactoylglutathione lyase
MRSCWGFSVSWCDPIATGESFSVSFVTGPANEMTTENEVMLEFGYAVVFVSDMKRSIEFYRDVLGLPLRFESQEWTEFDTSGTTLALHHTDAPSTADEHKDENPAGQCHPSFTVDDIDAYHERLTNKGVTCLQLPKEEEYGRKLAKYVDPDGLPFTLNQPPKDQN